MTLASAIFHGSARPDSSAAKDAARLLNPVSGILLRLQRDVVRKKSVL